MAVERTKIGQFENQSVEQLTLENANGVTARFITYGATLTALQLPTGAGESVNVTLGYDHLEDYINGACFFGCMVGRFANRIAGGRFSLAGQTFALPCNENGINTLHGGDRGLDKVVWDSEPTTIDGNDAIRFQCQSPDGDQGFPGNLTVAVTCVLTGRNELVFSYEAETDQPTPVNLTNHAYWNLAGAGNGDVLDHQMTIHAAQYLPVDDNLIPINELWDVAGTPMDFTEAHAIGERIGKVAGGYDHCYVVQPTRSTAPVPCAQVADPASGRRLIVTSTEPGVQFYSGNFLDNEAGADGQSYPKHGAFCLETQQFPDCVNQPSFPSAILQPGEVYRHETIYEFIF